MSFKAIFKTLKKRFGKKERAHPSGPFLYNVMMIPEVRKETELAMELRGRSAASMMVDAECAQLREMLGRKVDMVDSESSEAAQSISSESILAPEDDVSSLAGIMDEKAKEKDAVDLMSSKSRGLKASRHRDMPAERDVLCLMNFGHSSNKSATADAKSAVDMTSRRLKYDDGKIAARSEKAVLPMMGFGANAERVCSPTEKEVLEMVGFSRGTKKATPGCTAKTQEDGPQIGAQVSVSVGASVPVQRLSGGMGCAQASTHSTMARQEPIVERCDPGSSTNIGVGVKIDSSIAVPLSRVALPCEAPCDAKETGIPRSVLRSTNIQPQISARRRSPAAVSRKSGKENMFSNSYMNPRAAPAPPPTMPPFIRKAIQAVKEWDADITEDTFWAQV